MLTWRLSGRVAVGQVPGLRFGTPGWKLAPGFDSSALGRNGRRPEPAGRLGKGSHGLAPRFNIRPIFKEKRTMSQLKSLRLSGITKGPRPRIFQQQGVMAVRVQLKDQEEMRAAIVAAKAAAGAWLDSERPVANNTVYLLRPLDTHMFDTDLKNMLCHKQECCRDAAIVAVKKLRDPSWRSPHEAAAEEAPDRER
jgi:hypothetical protein